VVWLFSSVVIAAAALAACQRQDEAQVGNESQDPVLNLPSVPTPQPPIDRAALLSAVAQAASATAAGAEVPESLRDLDGRQFELRIRFGCRGQSTDLPAQWLGWAYEPESRTLRVRARPTISADDPLVAKLGGEQFESVEGFWIPRPWLLEALCPAAAAAQPAAPEQDSGAEEADEDAAEGPPPEPVPVSARIGIAQFFSASDARTRRRDSRPYQTVKTLQEGTPISSQGFNLVLSGRLRALPGRPVIDCWSVGSDSPPDCIISAVFQRVWIERPDNREVVAEWGGG